MNQSKNLKARNHMEDLGADNRTILNLLLKKSDGSLGPGLIWLGIKMCCGHFESIRNTWAPP
jgi:hypothetical protein